MVKVSTVSLLFLFVQTVHLNEICEETIRRGCCFSNGIELNYTSQIKWNVIDKKGGRIKISIPKHESESFELKRYDTTKECDETLADERYTQINETCEFCRYGNQVLFDSISTGCYSFEIYKSPSELLKSNSFIETDYDKDVQSVPMIINGTRDTRFLFKLINIPFDFNDRERFLLLLTIRVVDTNNIEQKWRISFPDTNLHPINLSKIDMNVCQENSQNNSIFINDIECFFKSIDTSIECSCELKSAYYYFSFELIDEPNCQICRWFQNFDVNIAPKDNTPEINATVNSNVYWLIPILFILIIITLTIYFKRRKKINSIERNEEVELINVKKEILLLYARDSKAFMETMEAFRTLLTIQGGLKVYDIYTVEILEKIFQDPSWFERTFNNCKIVLILTQCAEILFENDSNESLYQFPDPMDDVFIRAVSTILYNSELMNDYGRMYVCSFDKNERNFKNFNLITPQRRFMLPDKVTELIDELNVDSFETNADNTELFQAFYLKYNRYKEECEGDPNYLEKILRVKRSL